MKKTLTVLSFCFFFSVSWSQTDVSSAIEEGIALHDKAEYEAAIQKYDIALQIE